MKRVPAAVFALLVSASVFAENAPSYFLVHEEVVRPSMVAQYESFTRDLLAMLTAQNADPKSFGSHTYMSSDLHYMFVNPIAGYGAIDTIYGAWSNLIATVGRDRFNQLMSRGDAAKQSWSDWVMVRRADLSYTPATPRVKPDEIRFVHLTYYYLDPAHVADAEQVAKDWAALFKSKESGESYSVYQVVTGHDLPMLLVADYAKDAADFYAAQQRIAASLPEIRGLIARAGAATRRLEFRDVIAHPDLSYPLPVSK